MLRHLVKLVNELAAEFRSGLGRVGGPSARPYNTLLMTANHYETAKILALETSGRAGSVALALGPELLDTGMFSGPQRHAVELHPTVDELFRRHGWTPGDLDQVYISAGPGSFTGLRIAVTMARTLALAMDVRIVKVETVDVLARNAATLPSPPPHLAVVLDAKRHQIYTAEFALDKNHYQKIRDAQLANPDSFLRTCRQPVAVLGEGIPYHRKAIDSTGASILDESLWSARAEHVLTCGYAMACRESFALPEDLVPIYIRRPEAEEKWALRHADST